MAEQDFSEFVRRKTTLDESESGESLDWAKRRADWLRELDELYARMEDYLDPYTQAGKIQIKRRRIQLGEDHLGTYDADKLTFRIGREKPVAKPIGTMLIHASGRVDLSGPGKTLKIVLLAGGVSSEWLNRPSSARAAFRWWRPRTTAPGESPVCERHPQL